MRLPVIDNKFRHNIVKVAVDPRGDSRVDAQTTLTMLWRNSLSITGQMHEKLMLFIVFYNNRKVEGTKLSQNARQKWARNFKFIQSDATKFIILLALL